MKLIVTSFSLSSHSRRKSLHTQMHLGGLFKMACHSYCQVTSFTREWLSLHSSRMKKEQDKEAQKERRKVTKSAVEEWKKSKIIWKSENSVRCEWFHVAKVAWETERQHAKVAREKFTQPAPKLGELLKP
ncbi:hypothetical protein PAXRUDRAFT_792312 [Paxillus rubicundulus Ve08.2h10]|uniref:Remorin C-terminal domain-containing protein n=1 Tax=Paxillus rubicundulus Ve08.2h10 TaxID=930991 RepID=A0A0D0DUC2_9AGAM|nr:hypothetical protein PAXRUDRAFT_792312 [Paxillus rubicundulus Ve08.2h10]